MTTTSQLSRLGPGLALGGLLLGACGGNGTEGSGNPIRFDDLQVGQQSQYAVLVYSPFSSAFEYVDGVLVAEVIDHDTTGFRVREAFASPADVDEQVRGRVDPEGVYEYYLGVEGGVLRVLPADGESRSRLFHQLGSDPLELPLAEVAAPVVRIEGWKTTVPDSAAYTEAAILDGEIRGETYARLNLIIDNRAIAADGPGLAWLYSAASGLVRSTVHSWQAGTGTGFDLAPDRDRRASRRPSITAYGRCARPRCWRSGSGRGR